MTNAKDILLQTFHRRKALNKSYSQNAYARDLGISSAALSQFLAGKRQLSKRNLKNASEAVGYYLQAKSIGSPQSEALTKIKMDSFFLISDWYHLAILNLIEFAQVKSAADLGRYFEISKIEAENAVKRLLDLKFIVKKNGQFERVIKPFTTDTDVPSEALRKHNREKMELAIQALDAVAIEMRDITSMTMTFDPKGISKIKKEIERFKKRVSTICRNDQPTDVYSLNVQFFPLTKKTKSEI